MKPANIIKQIRATASKLEKEAIIKNAWDSGCIEFFKGTLLGLDPLITFGVKQVPEVKNQAKTNGLFALESSSMTFYELADKLMNRELTGNAARDAISSFSEGCDPDDWNLFYRLILLKDFKSGFSESTLNKALKKAGKEAEAYIVREFPYQRCCLPKDAKLKEFSWKDGVMSQKKSDGMFANVNLYKDGAVHILSRSGKPFPLEEFTKLVEDITKAFTANTQTHGELLVYRDGKELPREIGNGILNSVAQGQAFDNGDTPVYVVWDQIPLESVVPKGTCNTQYKLRFQDITNQVSKLSGDNIKLVEHKLVHSMEEAMKHYEEMLSLGFEGTIIKEPTTIWKDGTSKFQVKLKLEAECDLEIVGFNAGNGKNAVLFGSILAKSSDGLLEVGISGFKDDERKKIWDKHEELIGTIMTVRGTGVMKPSLAGKAHSIFLPRFVEFRLDKTEADDLQRVIDQFEEAKKSIKV